MATALSPKFVVASCPQCGQTHEPKPGTTGFYITLKVAAEQQRIANVMCPHCTTDAVQDQLEARAGKKTARKTQAEPVAYGRHGCPA